MGLQTDLTRKSFHCDRLNVGAASELERAVVHMHRHIFRESNSVNFILPPFTMGQLLTKEDAAKREKSFL